MRKVSVPIYIVLVEVHKVYFLGYSWDLPEVIASLNMMAKMLDYYLSDEEIGDCMRIANRNDVAGAHKIKENLTAFRASFLSTNPQKQP